MVTLLLKASFIIAIVLVFYKVFLEKESFFGTNRIYLIGCLVLAFVLPFVSLPKLVDDQGFISTIVERTDHRESLSSPARTILPENTQGDNKVQIDNPEKRETGSIDWLLWLYYFGVIIFSLNLFVQIVSILIKVRKSTDKVHDNNGVIINGHSVQGPCSFFHYIFINPERYDYDTYEQIVSHEKIHVRKLHAIDLLLTEIAVIVLWFNPLIWVFRKEVEKNIEYETDDLMLKGKTVEKERYQMNLLKIATRKKPLTITTNYNQSLLKQRILMMNAKKSSPHSYWKYAFIAPILFAMLLVINKPSSALARNANEPILINADKQNESHYPNDCKELLRAVKAKNIAKVKDLLKTVDPNCSYRGDGEPRSPLVAAARVGDLVIGKLLIDAGADVEFHAPGDETPLMAASGHGKLDFVKYLVTNGAEVNKKLGGDGSALLIASREGSLETVKYLISHGADVNGQVDGDGTPLICSVRNGHYEISRVLLENGADPYLVSPGDEYAMFHARMSKNKSIIDLLKKYERDN